MQQRKTMTYWYWSFIYYQHNSLPLFKNYQKLQHRKQFRSKSEWTAEFWKQRNQVIHIKCKSPFYVLYLAHIPRYLRKVSKQTIMSEPKQISEQAQTKRLRSSSATWVHDLLNLHDFIHLFHINKHLFYVKAFMLFINQPFCLIESSHKGYCFTDRLGPSSNYSEGLRYNLPNS